MHKQRGPILKTVLLCGALATASVATALPLLGKQKPGAAHLPDGFAPRGRTAAEEPADAMPPGRSANDAARQAQSLNGGGRVLSVEEANGGWRVKLLKDGNVRFVFVPQ